MKKYLKNISEQGSMMVEALAMLGLITMVTPILYKKAAERTTELQDINTATQLRTMSKALDDYIKDNYTMLRDNMASDSANIDPDDIKDYLPYNFETKSKLFNDFSFSIRKSIIEAADPDDEGTASFTGVVLAPLADEGDLPRIRASKIASMVGANGGIVEGTDIKGVQGTWNAPVADFIFKNADGENIDVKPNSLAISSVHAVTSSSGIASEAAASDEVLHRLPQDDPLLNTMETALLMGGNDIRNVKEIIAKDNKFTLDASGNIAATGNITASGELGGASANIGGLLKAGSAEIAAALDVGGTLTVTGESTLGGGVTTPKVKSDDVLTIVSGNGPIEMQPENNSGVGYVEVKGTIRSSAGAKIEGKLEDVSDDTMGGKVTLLSDGNLLVQGNARVTGNAYVDTDLIADSLYGKTEIGGGFISDGVGYNFAASADSVSIAKPNFTVGPEGNRRIEVADDKTEITHQNSHITLDSEKLMLAGGNDTESSYISLSDSEIGITTSSYGKLDITSATAVNVGTGSFNVGTFGNGNINLIANGDMGSPAQMELSGETGSFNISTSTASISGGDGILSATADREVNINANENINLTADRFKVDADNFFIDEYHMLLRNSAMGGNKPDIQPGNIAVSSTGIQFLRDGIINLPMAAGTGKTAMANDVGALSVPGYIRADRLVSNVAYPEGGVGDGAYNSAAKSDTDASKPYDAYQVNPAYTSVMHDIKLTTRGGARLSDILPDFINKGIYVLDNTYEETNDSKNWEDYKVNPSSGGGSADAMVWGKPGECDSPDCIASPWLGFVPTPQCPPGYSKVITISPIRWKMSEAYYVAGNKAIKPSELKSDIANFRKYFFAPTNPLTEQFTIEIGDATATNGGAHDHTARVLGYEDSDPELDYALPLTFQTNTWLNTTISGVYSVDGGPNTAAESGETGGQRMSTFVGWHAIMGFLYPAADYEDYLKGLGAWEDSWKDNGTIIWNLFPVYNEEMTAIANVYCYFERRIWSGDTAWEWNNEYVDGGGTVNSNGSITPGVGYDQLTNFRFGFEKNNVPYNKRLNDPALGYDEVW